MTTDQEVQDYLDSKFDGDYNDGVSHLKNLTLDPIFTMDDDRYFDVINRSSHANFHIDMSKLYDYYDVVYDENSIGRSSKTMISTPVTAESYARPTSVGMVQLETQAIVPVLLKSSMTSLSQTTSRST